MIKRLIERFKTRRLLRKMKRFGRFSEKLLQNLNNKLDEKV